MPRLYYDVRAVANHWEVTREGGKQVPLVFTSRDAATSFARTCARVMERTGCRAEVRVHEQRRPSAAHGVEPGRASSVYDAHRSGPAT